MIDEENQQLGVMPTIRALELAQEKGLDLVEVAPAAVPPVCRILDYSHFRYEAQKHERAARKKQRANEVKEIRLGVKIGEHDLATKLRHAGQFLAAGDRVRVTVRFRGREITHPDLGRALLTRAAETLAAVAVVERPTLMEGKSLFLVMAPIDRSDAGPTAAGQA